MTSPEFSRPHPVDGLPADGTEVTIAAEPGERAALARLAGVTEVKSLQATFTLKPRPAGTVLLQGHVRAIVTQTCTVSLESFDAEVDETVDLVFMPENGVASWLAKHKKRLDDDPSLDDEDPPDTIVNGRIDLGQLAAEYLSLGIDPYPRKPGIVYEADTSNDDKDPSPFAKLAQLKQGS